MVRKVVAEFDAIDGPFLQKMGRIDQSIARFEKGAAMGLGRVEKGINGLVASAGRLQMVGGLVAGAFGASMATSFLDQATRIQNGLRGIGADSEENFNKLFLAATRSLSGVDSFTSSVLRFQKVMGDKQTLDTTIRQVETLNKLMALSGKSGGERSSVVTQFTQALQSGVLQGDELRSLRENAPVEFLQALAGELGGTTANLKAFGEQGKITTDVMVAALTKLEAEADRRMGAVVLTFSDAATVLANGALKAAAEFDQGLGISRAGTAAISGLGKVLGDNAEAFEMWGKAAQVAIGFLGASYMGRRVQDAQAGLSRLYAAQTAGVQAAYAGAVKTQAAEGLIVAAKQKTVIGLKAKVAAMAAEGAAQAKVMAMHARLVTAETALTAARGRFTAATLAAVVAQERLAFSARAVVAAGALMRSAWAFIGGWPGLILLAGVALLTFAGNAETAAEKMDRMRGVTDAAKAAGDNLVAVQERLKEAMDQSGTAGTEAGQKIIAATWAELTAKRELLAFETERLRVTQAQRESDIVTAREALAQAQQAYDGIAALASRGVRGSALAESQLPGLAEDLDTARGAYLKLKVDALEAQAVIEGNVQLLADSGQMLAVSLADASGVAKALKAWLDGSADSMGRISGSNISGPIAGAAGWAQRLFQWLSKAASVVLPGGGAAMPSTGFNFPPSNNPGANGRFGTIPSGLGIAPIVPEPETGGGGGGGGGGGTSAANTDMTEALRLVEQMLTTEERRAKELADMVALRGRLMETYGPEAEIVGQMDEAITRAQDNLSGLGDQMDEFWGTLSDHVLKSVDEWKGWGNFIRGILGDLASKWGPEFFEALFTPGKQAGGGFGQTLGNLLTGGISLGGGGAGTALNPGGLINMASAGKSMASKQSSGMTIVQHNDFRGADQSMRAELMAQLNKRDRELPGKVIGAIRDAKRSRVQF